jgi:hypothetical protein
MMVPRSSSRPTRTPAPTPTPAIVIPIRHGRARPGRLRTNGPGSINGTRPVTTDRSASAPPHAHDATTQSHPA